MPQKDFFLETSTNTWAPPVPNHVVSVTSSEADFLFFNVKMVVVLTSWLFVKIKLNNASKA